jgi:hypothetical protein
VRHSIVRFLLATSLGIAIFLPTPSAAYLLRVDFTVTTGPGQNWAGYYAFDSGVIPVGGGTVFDPALSSLSFLYAGYEWNTTNALLTSMQFEADGSIHDWDLNSLHFYDPGYVGPQIDVLGFADGAGGEFEFWDSSVPTLVYGGLGPWTVTKVPAPGTLALLGIFPLALLRRRKH